MSNIEVPGDPASYSLELIRLGNSWLNALDDLTPDERRKAEEVFRASFAESTWKTYDTNYRLWGGFCKSRNWQHLPAAPAAVAYYVVHLGGVNKHTTIIQKVIAIAVAHRFAKFPDPTKSFDVKDCLKGVARLWGSAPQGKDRYIIDDILKLQKIYANHPNRAEACRDLTLMKVGIGLAQRGSQVGALDAEDFTLKKYGYKVKIGRTKTDQFGDGREIWLPHGLRKETCPVRQYQEWLDVSGITTGPVFRAVNASGRVGDDRLRVEALSEIIKRCMCLIGHDPERFGSHSMRVAFVSLAHENGADDETIKEQTGQKDLDTVSQYIRPPNYPATNTSIILGM